MAGGAIRLIAYDVIPGRHAFNFSAWKAKPGELDEMVGAVQEGEMPPVQYWIFHPGSKMDGQQKQDLIDALKSSIQ